MLVRFVIMLLSFWLIALAYLGVPVARQMMRNAPLTESVKPEKIEWSTEEIHDELWRPAVKYQYTVDQRSFEKNEVFQGYSYRNPYAAKEALKEISPLYPVVWFDPRNPQNSSMEKFFSKKQAVYFGIVLSLLIYFVIGGAQVVEKFSSKKQP